MNFEYNQEKMKAYMDNIPNIDLNWRAENERDSAFMDGVYYSMSSVQQKVIDENCYYETSNFGEIHKIVDRTKKATYIAEFLYLTKGLICSFPSVGIFPKEGVVKIA